MHVNPGEPEPQDCDYWWSQEHDRRFFTFIDQYRDGSQPEFVTQQSAAPRVRISTICLHSSPWADTHISKKKSCKSHIPA